MEKIHNISIFFLDVQFVDTNTVILKSQKYSLKCVCMYQKNNHTGEIFNQVSKFVLH